MEGPGGSEQISCTNSSYSPGISMHAFPVNKQIRAKLVKFVRTHTFTVLITRQRFWNGAIAIKGDHKQ